jgi:hypothetical protein
MGGIHAQVVAAFHAPVAHAAAFLWFTDDPLPHLKPFDLAAQGNDLAVPFMPHNEGELWRKNTFEVSLGDVNIRAAYAASTHPAEHLIGSRARGLKIAITDIIPAVQDGRFHGLWDRRCHNSFPFWL